MVKLLRILAFPVSLIYGLVVYLRNFLYDIGVLPSKTFETPVVCIGNLSVGGTGKTPMTEFLISRLQDTYKIAVLSRGYRRKSHGFLLADPSSTVEELGDEPYQIYAKFPNITLAVDADRRHGITALEEKIGPDIILMDDAFQHRRVAPQFAILLTAYNKLYPEDWYVPTGDLRDSKKAAKRANVIVVTKCPPKLSEAEQQIIRSKLNPLKSQSVLFSTLRYATRPIGIEKRIDLSELRHKKVTLVTGIADPRPLVRYLKNEKVNFEHLRYNDHHFFSAKELALFNARELILTTEKDFTRLKGRVNNLYYIEISHAFLGEGETHLKHAILNSLKRDC